MLTLTKMTNTSAPTNPELYHVSAGVQSSILLNIKWLAWMSVTLRRLDDEPILIVTYEGFLDLHTAEAVTLQVAQVLIESDMPLYGIIDLRAATTSMGEL